MPSNDNDIWHCSHCGEKVEPNFHICFSCGTSRDGELDASFQPAVVHIRERQHCTQCHYSLKGLQGSACPECGKSFDRSILDTPHAGPLPSLHGEQGFNHRLLHLAIGSWLALGILLFFMAFLPLTRIYISTLFVVVLFVTIVTTLAMLVLPADQSAAPDSTETPDPLCPHCMVSIGLFEHFCHHCASPISCHASTDPIGQIYSMGCLCRRATTSCTRLSTLIGMWLIFGPGMITSGFTSVIGLAILWQVTHRYIEHRKSREI